MKTPFRSTLAALVAALLSLCGTAAEAKTFRFATTSDAATMDLPLIREAHQIHNAEIGHIPLYHQMIPWAMAANVAAPHRADNILEIKWVKVD